MQVEKGRTFLKGTAILAGAGVLMKVLGAVFRIPLTNWLGAQGMSYYGIAYAIYGLLVVIGTAGVPVAVSKMVSENIAQERYRNVDQVFKAALMIMTIIGGVSFVVCFFGADYIAVLCKIPKASLAIRAMAPALFLVPFFSAFRGYFNGHQNMAPTAFSEIVEQLVRCGTGLVLAYTFFKAGDLVKAAAGASGGASAGAVGGLLVIFLIFLANRKVFRRQAEEHDQTTEDLRTLAKKLLWIAVPIVIGCEIMPIMTLIDTGIITRVLQNTGWTPEESEYMYGLFSGFCNALIAFPQIFTQAVAVSIVPAVSSRYKVKDMQGVHDTIRLGYRTTMIMAFPCAFGIFVIATPILRLLYFNQWESCADATPTLMVMAISIIFLATMQTSTSVLQSVGKQYIPVRNLAIGCIGKVVVTYILVGIHSINIMGAAFGTMFAYSFAMLLNAYCVKKYTGLTYSFTMTYLRPGIAAAGMAVVTWLVYHGLFTVLSAHHGQVGANMLATVIAILAAMVVYVILIFAVKAIHYDELDQLPGGGMLNKVIGKVWKH